MIRKAVFACWGNFRTGFLITRALFHAERCACHQQAISAKPWRRRGVKKFEACERHDAPKLCCGLSDLILIEVHCAVLIVILPSTVTPVIGSFAKRRRFHGKFSSSGLVGGFLALGPPATCHSLACCSPCLLTKTLVNSTFSALSAGSRLRQTAREFFSYGQPVAHHSS